MVGRASRAVDLRPAAAVVAGGGHEAPHEVLVALTRVYAVREAGRWVLSSALPHLTAGWRRAVVGPISYVFPPEHRFDAARARRAVRFADSLAAAFGAPRPHGVTYYLARTPEEAFGLAGVDYTPPGAAGRTVPANRMVFSGLPAYGEYYPHELVHLVLDAPAAARGATALHTALHTALRTALSTPGALTAEAPGVGAGVEQDAGPDVLRGATQALGLSRAALDAAWRRALAGAPR